jgi:HK97 family phage portal protein
MSPIPVLQFLTRRSYTGDSEQHRPAYNAIPISIGGSRLQAQGISYRELWARLKRSPELLSTISIPIVDILSDRPLWTAPDGSMLGKNTRMKAERYWTKNHGKTQIEAFLYDAFLTGDGFLWLGIADKDARDKAVRAAFATFKEKNNYSDSWFKEMEVKAVAEYAGKGGPEVFQHISSSTVRIHHNNYDILAYEQIAPAAVKSWFKPEEIVHFKFMTINGEIQGFSPAEALLAEIMLLWLVKGNMTSFMRNGGSPDKVFVLPQEIARSPNHQYLLETLRKYKSIENRHGSLVFTGQLDVKDLQGSPKDLEYKDLALYITSNIAFAYGIPVSRIPYLIGSASSKGDSGGLAEAGYWNRISYLQDTIEDLLNERIFGPHGWRIKFNRRYKQDEVREAQIQQMNADTVWKFQDILSRNGMRLKTEKVVGLLHLTPEDIEEGVDDSLQQGGVHDNRQDSLNTHTVQKEPDKQRRDQSKRDVATRKAATKSAFQA